MALTPSARLKGRPVPKRWRPGSIHASSTLLRLAGVDAGEVARPPAGSARSSRRPCRRSAARTSRWAACPPVPHGAGQLEPRRASPPACRATASCDPARPAAKRTKISARARARCVRRPLRKAQAQVHAARYGGAARPRSTATGPTAIRARAPRPAARCASTRMKRMPSRAHGVAVRAARLLVAGIAPEVLLRALADQPLHLRVHLRRRAGGVGGQFARPGPHVHAVAAAPAAGARPRPAAPRRRSAAPAAPDSVMV